MTTNNINSYSLDSYIDFSSELPAPNKKKKERGFSKIFRENSKTFYEKQSKTSRSLNIKDLRSIDKMPIPCAEKVVKVSKTDKSPAHLRMKDFIKALQNWRFDHAGALYQQMDSHEKQTIEENIYRRCHVLPFIKKIDHSHEAAQILNFYFNTAQIGGDALHFFKEYLLPAAQEHLIQHYEQEKHLALIKLAQEAFSFVRDITILSGNHPNRDNKLVDYLGGNLEDQEDVDKFHELSNEIDGQLKILREIRDLLYDEFPKHDDFLKILSTAQFFKDFSIGNCHEMSSLAFDFLRSKGKKVDFYFIENGDHLFLVLNRQKNSNPRDFTTWGPHCLVLDLWSEKINIFSAHDIPIHLEDYKQLLDFFTRSPITKKFDPQQQGLCCRISNLYSVNDFNGLTDKRYDKEALTWFQSQLTAFEKTKEVTEKSAIAHEIINYRQKINKVIHPQNKQIVKNLISQMKAFLDPNYGTIHNLSPKTSKKQSDISDVLLNSDIDCDFLDECISDITIKHLMKIADLLEQGETESALKKFLKLDDSTQDDIDNYLSRYLKSKKNTNGKNIDEIRAKSIYVWLAKKLELAQKNQKIDEIAKIVSGLSPHALLGLNTFLKEML
jgi:hypothetical protein